MKITKEQLKQIIKEEIEATLSEQDPLDDAERFDDQTFDSDKILSNQPGLGFDLGSQAAFGELFARYDGGKDTAQMGQDFEKIAQIDPELSDVFKALILSNPILFPNETPGSIDLLRNDPEAVDAALAAIPDEPEELEEDISDSLVKEIQNLLKQQGNL